MSSLLIVEDEAELVRALRINLRARHYEVQTASSGREALAAVASHPGSSSAPTISAFTWPACVTSWKTTRRAPATCSPHPTWAIATNRNRT